MQTPHIPGIPATYQVLYEVPAASVKTPKFQQHVCCSSALHISTRQKAENHSRALAGLGAGVTWCGSVRAGHA